MFRTGRDCRELSLSVPPMFGVLRLADLRTQGLKSVV